MNAAISEVVARCDEAITLEDIDRLSTSLGITREQFYEAVLMFVAAAFLRGDLTFKIGDAVANRLWALSEFSLSGRAREVFFAFDEGEYYHSGDARDSDPVELYTRPQLAAILREGERDRRPTGAP